MYKPFTPIDQQIELMQSRGMGTGTSTRSVLEREGYYAIINGYKDPFIDQEATRLAGDDRFLDGTTFEQVYALFLFDRNLRFLLFEIMTDAEALLRTCCSYTFSESHPDEKNAYLNPDNYILEGDRQRKVTGLIRALEKVIRTSEENRDGNGKAYMIHCLQHHDGEVPLWVLANDLTIGQIYWFFQALTMQDRGTIARRFTDLYAQSHKTAVEINSARLDTVYRRVKDFRNICAHDERLYCAHPHDKNATAFQLVRDLRFLTTKPRYLEFLQQLRSLLAKLDDKIPGRMDYVYASMGSSGLAELDDYMEEIRKC
ncbi:MAG: Abi family protein [Bifidobacterium sp.]|nr:Abi family protein [Bifidobacterium sp.]